MPPPPSPRPADPGGAEPAPLGGHDGRGRGRPHVLRAGQGHGPAAALPRLPVVRAPGPAPRGPPAVPARHARHQPPGRTGGGRGGAMGAHGTVLDTHL